MLTSKKVKDKTAEFGADICCIAPVDRFDKAPRGFHPNDIDPRCRSIVVFASRFPISTVHLKSPAPYTFERHKMVEKMDAVSFRLSCFFEREGLAAVPIPSAEPYDFWDNERRHGRGILSLKHAGELAGLGCMGKNTLLINKTYGNMVWLGAVLVSIELEADPPIRNSYCPDACRICIEACPQKALDGKTIDQKACRERSIVSTEGGGWVLSCNICRKICPKYDGVR